MGRRNNKFSSGFYKTREFISAQAAADSEIDSDGGVVLLLPLFLSSVYKKTYTP
jgi:hypothetical protein